MTRLIESYSNSSKLYLILFKPDKKIAALRVEPNANNQVAPELWVKADRVKKALTSLGYLCTLEVF